MKTKLLALALAMAPLSLAALAADSTPGATTLSLFNDGWQFSLEDAPAQSVTLPHDWSIASAPQADAPMGKDGGYYAAGKGSYAKTFRAGQELRGRKVSLCFDGVYMLAKVILNGQTLAEHAYGYTPFEVDITDALDFDGDNTLVVEVDNSRQKNCRWYTGSGINRDVMLKSEPKAGAVGRFAVSTRKQDGGDYVLALDCRTPVVASVAAPGGEVVAQGALPLVVPTPREWSPASPVLYTLTLMSEADTVAERIGFRDIQYSAENGLVLNGQKIKLSGACVHHDNGPLGAAAYKDADTRRVALLKNAGFNAVRTSHNPPSKHFLDACDSIGLLVVDEIFDGWRSPKLDHDYSELFDDNWQQDVDAWIARDVNHPSIWCWSVGNEVMERAEPECVMTARKLIGRVHSLDPYRPVTSAMCSWGQGWDRFDPLMAEHDICGYNYYLHEAANDHKRVPSRVIMQTESFPREAAVNYHRVYDNDCVIGDFVWTGIDYLGESGIGRYYYEGQTPGEHWEREFFPWHGAYCGDIDLLGWRKPISYQRDLLYNHGNDALFLAVREPDGYYGKVCETLWSVWPAWPRWTWKGWEGKDIDVVAYANAQAVRLYLNGKLVGESPVVDCEARFTLPYKPGTLKAVAIVDGREAGQAELRTAGKPAAIKLDKEQYGTLTYVTATVVDKRGIPVPGDYEFEFSADGTEILATASADLTDETPATSPKRRAFNSMAQAIVLTKPGAALTARVPALRLAATAK